MAGRRLPGTAQKSITIAERNAMSTKQGHISAGRLFYNGIIHTMDETLPFAPVLAVRGGRIAYVGSSRPEAAALLAPGAEQVDLRGRTVVPGLIDSHQHFILQGRRLTEMDIHLKPKAEILRQVAMKAKEAGPGEWILGRGWNHDLWPGRQWPRKEDLDAVAPANPVALTRLDGHSMWVNSEALRIGGLDNGSPDFAGGEILRDPDGELRGILIDTALFKVRAAIPPLDRERKREACLRAQAEMFSHGITSVGDAWQEREDYEFLKGLHASGKLRIRIYGMLSSRVEGRCIEEVDGHPVAGLFEDRLSLRAFKVVLDGSLGSRSAWLTADYADRAGHRGNNRYSDEHLVAVLRSAASKGFQLCIHAIGDAAVLQAIRALEAVRGDNPGQWLRHRIEHFQMAGSEAVDRAMALGVIAAMQAIHAVADKPMAETRLTPAQLAISYPWRAVLDRGGIIANGSDSPMDGVNPFHGFHAAVTRTAFSCCPEDDSRVRMTREEALKSYTVWAAAAEQAGGRKGSLTPGKAADFAVLDRDIMTCPEDEVRDTRVLMTVVAGETVYGGL